MSDNVFYLILADKIKGFEKETEAAIYFAAKQSLLKIGDDIYNLPWATKFPRMQDANKQIA